MDYNSGPYTVTFLAGVTMVAFNIPIINDNTLDNEVYFMLIINSSSLPGSVRLGTPHQATVTIMDDDRK